MRDRLGFAPIVIIIAVAILLGAGVSGYVLVSKRERADSIPPSSGSVPSVGSEEQGTPAESSSKTSEPPKSSKKSVVSTDPKLLEGLWRIETAYEWVNPPGVWKESEELKTRITYQEFKNGTMCRGLYLPSEVSNAWPENFEEALRNLYCVKYDPYKILKRSEFEPRDSKVSGIAFDEPYSSPFQWKIVDGKLEFEKSIYVKTSGTREKPIFKDTEEPKITSFQLSSPSVRVGNEITMTCSATDNSGNVLIVFDIAGVIAGGTANAASGGQYHTSGGSDAYAYKPLFAGSYTVTCQASDEAQNKTESSLTFSVSQ